MLPSRHRLPRQFFVKINTRGRRVWGDYLLVKYIPAPDRTTNQFGIVVSTKISKKAVDRNHIKRLISENLRLHFTDHQPAIQAVIIARQETIDKDFHHIGRDLQHIFSKIKY